MRGIDLITSSSGRPRMESRFSSSSSECALNRTPGFRTPLIRSNEVSDKTTPVDSTYAKKTLVGLHPNIMVQRSPSHFQTGTFYWSHVSQLLPSALQERAGLINSTRRCVSSTKRSLSWEVSIYVTVDGILPSTSLLMKTILLLMDLMDLFGEEKITPMREW
jgi:hypothetical protein